MRPIRTYDKATIFLKKGGHTDGFDVCVFGSLITYFTEDGDEKVIPLHQIQEVAHYVEERKEQK